MKTITNVDLFAGAVAPASDRPLVINHWDLPVTTHRRGNLWNTIRGMVSKFLRWVRGVR